MPLQERYLTPISPSVPYPQLSNTDQTTSVVADQTPISSVKVEENDNFEHLASSSHNHQAEVSDQIAPADNPPPSQFSTPKIKEKDADPEWEAQRGPKRRRIDQNVHMEGSSTDAGANAGQPMDASTHSAVDIASEDLPAWRVKLEETPADDDQDKPMEGDDIDELRDEDISRVSNGNMHHAGSSTQEVGHISPHSDSSSSNAHWLIRPAPSQSPVTVNGSHLKYVYIYAGNKLICTFCA
jgi:hypothetical protein